jgi:Secretory lipase
VKKLHAMTAIASAVLLAACGGGDDGDNRGTLLEAPQTVATLTAAQIEAGATASGLRPLTGPARCDVKVVALNYATIGVNAEAANASGAMLVPAGACANQSYPLVAYAKGTDVQKPRTLANPADAETFLLAAMYAAQGYAVVASDYLGYAKSTYSYHPYLHADSEASSVVDSIRAARNAAAPLAVGLSGQVMLTGYSQGGHASMAAHRAIERDIPGEINIAAAAHLAGPYNLSGSFQLTNAIAGYQFFVPFLVTAWQKVYGNVYASVTQAFKEPYSNYIETLLPSPTLNFTTLVTTGALPGGPGVTPNAARDLVFQPAFLADVQSNPANGLMLDARRNDLLGWNPRARTLLCGGAGDPTVPGALHMGVAQADFASRGLTNVTSVDVDPVIQATFGVGGSAPTDPASPAFATYYGNYHGTYEPPLCHAQARVLFDSVR